METERARNIALAEYWDDHPYLTRHEAERALGMIEDVPNSTEIDSLKQDIQQLTKQVANLRKAMQQMAEKAIAAKEQVKSPERRQAQARTVNL